MLNDLLGQGISVQGQDYEIVGVTGGDAYHPGGPTVFDVFEQQAYVFRRVSRGTVTGNIILSSSMHNGIFKLRRGSVINDTAENVNSTATLHIKPTEPFVEAHTPIREHYTLTLQQTDFSDFEEVES